MQTQRTYCHPPATALRITLQTGSRTGVQVVPFRGASEALQWDGPDDGRDVVRALIETTADDGDARQRVALDGETWRAFDATGSLMHVVSDICSGGRIEDALAAQLNEVENTYVCECGETWQDTWSCACDDECPRCGIAIGPTRSVWRQELTAVPDGDVLVCSLRSEDAVGDAVAQRVDAVRHRADEHSHAAAVEQPPMSGPAPGGF